MPLKNYKEILQKEAQRVDIKDRKIFERGSLPSFFGRGVTDTIEFILYDNGDNQLPQGESGKLVRYVNIADVENIRKYILIARGKTSNATTEYFVDIERLINEAGYKNGLFRTQISLLNKRVGSEANQNKVWIHEISPSRTEIRVLPIKPDTQIMEDDLNERYNIFLRNGEFRDDVVNRLDGFIDTITTEKVLKKLNALFGADWIKNVKREFKIDDFEKFIDQCVVKAKEAIGYYVSNRQYKIGTKDYGKPMIVNKNQTSFDLSTLVKTSNEIICDIIAFYLPKRNVQVQSVPSITKLESRDRIDSILQSFGTSRKIDTKVSVMKRVVKPLKVTKAKVVSEKPAPSKDVVIKGDTKRYYYYQVTSFRKRILFKRRKSSFVTIEYIQMDGDKVSFTLPNKKSVRVCALEGSVKAINGRARIIKKELCVTDTPVPKFVTPKVQDDIKPKDLTKDQQDIINNLPDIDKIKENIRIEFQPPKFDMEKMRREIKKKLTLPKISFPTSFLVGAVNPANLGKFTGFVPKGPDANMFNRTVNQNLAASFMRSFKRKPKPVIRRKPIRKPTPIVPTSLRTIKPNKNVLRNVRNKSINNIFRPKRKSGRVRTAPPKRRFNQPILPQPSRKAGRISFRNIRKPKSSLGSRTTRAVRSRVRKGTFLGRTRLARRNRNRG